MNRVLITGGAGFIGSHCVDLFLSRGWEVGVFDLKAKEEAVNVTHTLDSIMYIQGDIRVRTQLDAIMGDYTHVLHLAADVSVQHSIENPIETHNTNVTGTLNVLHSAQCHAVKHIVYASSAAVYGNTDIIPTPETIKCIPTSPYGLHKKINEEYAELFFKQFGLMSTGVRFFNVYGSRQDPSSPYSGVISIFHKCMKEGRPPTVYGDGTATRDFIHVYDVANACLSILESTDRKSAIYNIGTGIPISLNELIQELYRVLKVQLTPVYSEEREGDIMHSCSDSSLIMSELDFCITKTLTQGLEEMLENED